MLQASRLGAKVSREKIVPLAEFPLTDEPEASSSGFE